MMQKHFVTFLSPGSFVAEETTKEIDSWDTDKAKEMAKKITERYNATPYGFYFTTRGRSKNDLDSKVIKKSNMYFLGGTVKTIDEIGEEQPGSILHSNMTCNKWNRVIINDNSWRWTQPLDDKDIVLEWP